MSFTHYFRSLIITLSVLILLGLQNIVLANEAVDKGLVTKLSDAQNRLNSSQKKIASQKRNLLEKLNKLEEEVQNLQQKTAAARRLSDEKTLSLNQLESRIKDWREQQRYQQNLLNRFLHQQQLHNQPAGLATAEKMQLIQNFSQELQAKLSPKWQPQSIVMSNGKVEQLPTLSLGPLNWFWHEELQQAGLASRENGQLHATLLLDGSASSGLKDIQTEGRGELFFDPTVNRAVAREQHQQTAWQHVVKGGVWVIPILTFAVLALVIAIYKSVQLARLPKLQRFTPAYLQSQLSTPSDKVVATIKGQQKVMFDIALQAKNDRVRDDQLFVQLQQDKYWLERWLLVIGITASVAPLLGLLGTVSGMIETFKMMTLFGSGDPEVVSGGIAQALITTELGLVVAIPALILNAILSKRAKSYYHELENFAVLLSQPADEPLSELKQEAA
ncbi:MotA/TolQ/ExbB proton channel family protein [Aliiglaciecola sp. 3_MG-2023]|uniref:MotA/TolQ/ExbB proton channel family protein n=1 Tax=Aliiglaciecola sp. 3_MG-2023 TaxID=3062644 RepID=UPI0026E33C8F|nr:MotA/TolQ/ExbB proton channel family protein [Aliiglaciecola sp. 3_MG-2023]MDO6694216.1 MotA/TolQ/ExbB proton channel family protein [Aliiglaciecola sp. 3_MG-2023]